MVLKDNIFAQMFGKAYEWGSSIVSFSKEKLERITGRSSRTSSVPEKNAVLNTTLDLSKRFKEQLEKEMRANKLNFSALLSRIVSFSKEKLERITGRSSRTSSVPEKTAATTWDASKRFKEMRADKWNFSALSSGLASYFRKKEAARPSFLDEEDAESVYSCASNDSNDFFGEENKGFFQSIKGFFVSVINFPISLITSACRSIRGFFGSIANAISNAGTSATNAISNAGTAVRNVQPKQIPGKLLGFILSKRIIFVISIIVLIWLGLSYILMDEDEIEYKMSSCKNAFRSSFTNARLWTQGKLGTFYGFGVSLAVGFKTIIGKLRLRFRRNN